MERAIPSPGHAARAASRARLACNSLPAPAMEGLQSDVRYAVRVLARSPGFTAAAALALALGVGGTSAMFSVLQGVVLRPLSTPEPERVFRLYEKLVDRAPGNFSDADYLDFAAENSSFE